MPAKKKDKRNLNFSSTAYKEEVESPKEGVDEKPQSMLQGNEPKQSTMEPQEKDTRRPESENQMWSDSPASSQKKSNAGIWVALVVLLLLAGLGAGGYYFYTTKNAQSATEAEEASQIIEAPTEPTATPTPAVNRAEWTIDVQNGTSTAGLAKKVADELKALGYNVGKVGNAAENVDTSELHVTSSDETKAGALLGDFKTYGVDQVTGDLKKTASDSAQLIIGANYTGAGTTTSTTTPTTTLTPEE